MMNFCRICAMAIAAPGVHYCAKHRAEIDIAHGHSPWYDKRIDPADFIALVLDVKLEPWQEEFLRRAFANSRLGPPPEPSHDDQNPPAS